MSLHSVGLHVCRLVMDIDTVRSKLSFVHAPRCSPIGTTKTSFWEQGNISGKPTGTAGKPRKKI